ncbi:MAG TPA: acetyl-CoA C-acetyltransferase [Symbiobacteriaceae bacterium]|nr:acetyl-CoA C-acetyltransferase [Symbiobacteriaceae bacterium]
MKREAVIVSAVRTPFGSFGGGLKELAATDLGAVVIREAVRRGGLTGREAEIDNVFMGQVVQAAAGQIPSRQATHKAGLPVSVPSETVNKVCASSLRAVNLADMTIRAGDAETVVAGGMESMSNAPYYLTKARWGQRMGNGELIDAVVYDGLTCSFGGCHMGVYGSEVAAEYGISRQAQDEWAFRSHQRAMAAWDAGRFADEVIPVPVPQRKGDPVPFSADESIRRDSTLEKLAGLKPAFQKDGTITAGNAPGLSDGASALVVMSRERAEALGLEVLATIVGQGQHSEEPKYLHTVPARAGFLALKKAGIGVKDLGLVEINEAFAAVTLTSVKLLECSPEIVNVNGGAVALGHPIGASGGRILMHLIYELRRRGGGYGLAAICSGGGQGEATVVRVG